MNVTSVSLENKDNDLVVFCDPLADAFCVKNNQIECYSEHHISLNPHMRLMVQYEDGITHQWENITQMQQVVGLLCGSAELSRNVISKVYNSAGVAVPMSSTLRRQASSTTATTTTKKTNKKDSPVSFFWIDIYNKLSGGELDVLFDYLNVNRRTRARWKEEAAVENVSQTEYGQRGFCSNSVEAEVDLLAGRGEDNAWTGPDEVHAFVKEQYVDLRLAAIVKKKNDNNNNNSDDRNSCVDYIAKNVVVGDSLAQLSSLSFAGGMLIEPENKFHQDLFNVDEVDNLCSIFLLCFSRGIVTWRPTPDVEGWEFISHSVERHIAHPLNFSSGYSSSLSAQQMITTSFLLRTIFDELCEAFLIDPTVFLDEVEAIDTMLPLLRQRESDQADMLRRALLLRRRLSVHRRLLSSKLDVLERLSRPAMGMLLAFIIGNNGKAGTALNVSCGSTVNFHHNACFSVANRIKSILFQLDSARTFLGNATILYTSSVAVRNQSDGNENEYRMISLQYVLLITLPLTILASQWGMNCYVPWQDYNSTTPFWSIVGFMAAYSALLLAYPLYCCVIGRPDKLVL